MFVKVKEAFTIFGNDESRVKVKETFTMFGNDESRVKVNRPFTMFGNDESREIGIGGIAYRQAVQASCIKIFRTGKLHKNFPYRQAAQLRTGKLPGRLQASCPVAYRQAA